MSFRSVIRAGSVLAMATLSAACATTSSGPMEGPAVAMQGYYQASSDGSWFRACGSAAGDRLWVTFVDQASRQRERLLADGLLQSEPTFVRWLAHTAREGSVGPGGPALLVREIQEARAATGGDCQG